VAVATLLRAVLLLVGDIAVLTAFTVTGRRSHDEAAGLTAFREVAVTAAPFVIGWLVAAAPLGALRRTATETLPAMLARTTAAWLAAFPLAAVIRALILGRFSPWTFYAVAFTVALLMLLLWRAAFAVFEARRSAYLAARG
jgi:hypothetical protein